MSTINDLETKRGELNTAVDSYKQDQSPAVLDAAKTRGYEYAKLTSAVRKANPAIAEDDLFSNPTVQNSNVRTQVATIIRTGKLEVNSRYDFSTGNIDSEALTLTARGDSRYEFVQEDGMSFLRLHSSTISNSGYRISLTTNESFSVGTSFKIRVRQSSRNQVAGIICMWNGRYDGTPYTAAVYTGDFSSHQFKIGGGTDESGTSMSAATPPIGHIDVFEEFELRRVSSTRIEWYREGTFIHATEGEFSNTYPFEVELFRDRTSNTIEHLDIEYIEISHPPR